jgi:hypothetical protein
MGENHRFRDAAVLTVALWAGARSRERASHDCDRCDRTDNVRKCGPFRPIDFVCIVIGPMVSMTSNFL